MILKVFQLLPRFHPPNPPKDVRSDTFDGWETLETMIQGTTFEGSTQWFQTWIFRISPWKMACPEVSRLGPPRCLVKPQKPSGKRPTSSKRTIPTKNGKGKKNSFAIKSLKKIIWDPNHQQNLGLKTYKHKTPVLALCWKPLASLRIWRLTNIESFSRPSLWRMTLSTDSQLTINIDAHHATSADLKTTTWFKGLLKQAPKRLGRMPRNAAGLHVYNCMVKKSLYINIDRDEQCRSMCTKHCRLPVSLRSIVQRSSAKRLWRDTNGVVQVSTRLPLPPEHPLIHVAHQRLSHPHRWHHQILRRPLRRCCLLPWRKKT